MDNQKLVEKAVITTDALAVQGKLNPAQAQKFLDYVFDLSGLKSNARTVRFTNETLEINKIGVGKRVAMPAAEATDPTTRRGVSTAKIALQPKEVIVPFEVSDNFREINLEGDNVEDHIIKMMAAQLGNDLEQLYVEGDTKGRAVIESDILEGGADDKVVKDSYLALADGWLRKADSAHIVDFEGANVGSNLFSKMLMAMPAKFRRNKADLRFITSPELEQNYREKVSSRATASGDNALTSTSNLTPFGVPLVPFTLYPFKYREVEHVKLTGTDTIALRRKNIANVVVTLQTLAGVATTPYVETTDYTVDYANGTITRVGNGNIGAGADVKVTYDAPPSAILTNFNNLVVAIGRDIRIEKDRNIFRRANLYAITCKVDVQVEETDALVKAVNVGSGT